MVQVYVWCQTTGNRLKNYRKFWNLKLTIYVIILRKTDPTKVRGNSSNLVCFDSEIMITYPCTNILKEKLVAMFKINEFIANFIKMPYTEKFQAIHFMIYYEGWHALPILQSCIDRYLNSSITG